MLGFPTVLRSYAAIAGSALVVLADLAAEAAPHVTAESCASSALRDDRLDAIGQRGELTLASGTRAILSEIHWPETEPEATEAKAFLSRFQGRPLTISQRGAQDRWGRSRIDAVAEPDAVLSEPADLAMGLVTAGLAHADAGESDLMCRADLIASEAEPRAGHRGVWREAIHDPQNGAALGALAGRFVVAEGRIIGVGERSARTYLDFVRDSASGLTVTVTKRTWRIMQGRGLTAATLRGRLVRVRGRLEIRRGPVLDIASADMIEVLEGGGR